MSNHLNSIVTSDNLEQSVYSRFVADIGGTHARFALVENSNPRSSELVEIKVFKCADFSGPAETFLAYQSYLGHSLPERACIAAAGPVSDGEVSFTNLDWRISAAGLCDELKLKQLEIVNDFTAVAYAVSKLSADDRRVIHSGSANARGLKVVLGAGTGLGVAALDEIGGQTHVIDSEAGHTRFAPASEQERQLLKVLSRSHDFVSMEMLLAGPGIPFIHEALCKVNGTTFQPMRAEEITSHARNGTNASCEHTMQIYLQILATFCSNLAVTFGARGGVYMVGDVLRSIEPLMVRGDFLECYLNAGSMSKLVDNTPLSLVLVQDPGLQGAAVCGMANRG
ncbi:MAG: glucokinase [Gammaproteobacteria bacterium]